MKIRRETSHVLICWISFATGCQFCAPQKVKDNLFFQTGEQLFHFDEKVRHPNSLIYFLPISIISKIYQCYCVYQIFLCCFKCCTPYCCCHFLFMQALGMHIKYLLAFLVGHLKRHFWHGFIQVSYDRLFISRRSRGFHYAHLSSFTCGYNHISWV